MHLINVLALLCVAFALGAKPAPSSWGRFLGTDSIEEDDAARPSSSLQLAASEAGDDAHEVEIEEHSDMSTFGMMDIPLAQASSLLQQSSEEVPAGEMKDSSGFHVASHRRGVVDGSVGF
mmetsp:Transcript_32677/g.60918  ORF Transcript_32677/g.60918 Transcript_32677/m.60918 type:complete len:120 (+) Transcript_32677:48-407(+)